MSPAPHKEFLGEITKLAAGDVAEPEAQKARETFRNEAIQSFGTLGGIVRENAELLALGSPFETTASDLAVAAKANPASLNSAASAGIKLNQAVLVLVGDKALILDQIKDLGLPTPTEVDPQGRPVGK